MSALREAVLPGPRGHATPALLAAGAIVAAAVTVAISPEGHGRAATPAAPAERVVLSLAGTGPTSSAAFTTGADWALSFSFSCEGRRGAGFRVVQRGGTEDGIALADRLGAASHGTTYAHGAAGRQWLVVETACRWSVVVIDGAELPRAGDAVGV